MTNLKKIYFNIHGVSVEVIIVGDSRVTSGSVCATVSLVLSVSLAFQVYRPKVVVFGKNEIMMYMFIPLHFIQLFLGRVINCWPV